MTVTARRPGVAATRSRTVVRAAAAVALLLGSAGLTACSAEASDEAAEAATATGDAACAPLVETYGTFPEGTVVTVATPFNGEEAQAFDASLATFAECTGLTVVQDGSNHLEADLRAVLPTPSVAAADGVAPEQEQGETAETTASAETPEASADAEQVDVVPVPAQAGAADLVVVPQPGLVEDLVAAGAVQPLPEVVAANIELGWQGAWVDEGTVDATLYAAPLMASVKSFIWYSPSAFAAAGYEVPGTWDELEALTAQVVSDHPDGDVAPWCLGAADGAATGWALTDWLEDALLATRGTTAYDSWAEHRVPLDDVHAVTTLETLEDLLLAEGHVPGGRETVGATTLTEAGEQLVDGTCLMLHASSSFETLLPEGTAVTDGEDPEAEGLSAFLLPSVDSGERAVVVGGDYLVAREVTEASTAVMRYLTSAEWAARRVAMGGVASANRGARGVELSSPVAQAASDILQSRSSVIRFDASDMMPSQVGTRALWDALSRWAAGESEAADALGEAESAWPPAR